jgi:hypothetical protein
MHIQQALHSPASAVGAWYQSSLYSAVEPTVTPIA